MVEKNKRNGSFDIFRLVGAILVIFIHANKGNELLFFIASTFSRCIVPIFMIISGFYYLNITDSEVKKQRIKRLFTLWLSWMVVYIPLGLLSLKGDNVDIIVIKIIRSVIGSSIFYSGSWYLIAVIFGLIIIDKLSNSNKKTLIKPLVLIIFTIDLLTTNYSWLITNKDILNLIELFNLHSTIITGILWIFIAKYLLDNKNKLKRLSSFRMVLASISVLIAEFFIINKSGVSPIFNDMYITLPFTVMCLFLFLLNHPVSLEKDQLTLLSNLSTLLFFSQFGVIRIVKGIGLIENAYLYLIICIIGSFMVSFCILKLSKIEKLKFLKKLY